MDPFIVGITGGIGSGKSCVSRLLASYCLVPLIDVDQCCRRLLDVGEPGWNALTENFGRSFLLPDQRIDRAALRDRLFSEDSFRRRVDDLLHPLAQEAMQQEVAKTMSPLVFVEIPLLYEAGWQKKVGAVLVVYARRGRQCCRIMLRDGVSRRKAAQSIASQMDLGTKAKQADYCIDNSGAWSKTRVEVIRLGDAFCKRFSEFF
ncbi:MAG: dephospho-CoA kinase [Desulfobulbus sp.]|nr:dephospho-CoA kinase [Desulfobulbus sp.]